MAFTEEEITQIYVATFNRAPDEVGLNYWMNDSGLEDINDVARSFFDSDEAQVMYPSSVSSTELVQTAYQNLFSREADDGGLAYWTYGLDNGFVSQSLMLQTMINGAQGDDALIIQNKTQVGIDFASRNIDNKEIASTILQNITYEESSVQEAYAIMDAVNYEENINNVNHDTLGGFTGNFFNGMSMALSYSNDTNIYVEEDTTLVGVVNIEESYTTDFIA